MRANQLVALLTTHGQNHIVEHFLGLPSAQQSEFLQNCSDLDFDLLFRLYRECVRSTRDLTRSADIRPPRVIPIPRNKAEHQIREKAKRLGELLISNGKVAVLIVAGGQGVRLGHDKPKGTFPITPIMNKTLFQLFSEQIRALSLRHKARIPLLIMTSHENHDETRAYFKTCRFFGLPERDVHFFQQDMLPSITPNGELILKNDTQLFVNPDGHGGSLRALHKSGLLDLLLDQGFSELFYCQVDNPLAKIADPTFLGYHHMESAECSTKVVRRYDVEEKVGIYVSLNGKDAIIEYSDYGGAHMRALDKDGNILYWAGNTAIHALNLSFIRRLNDRGFALPYHCASKVVDISRSIQPQRSLEVWKFETFVFDAIPLAKKTLCMEVDRREEFAPVKNKSGPDSPATARASLTGLYRTWLTQAGIVVPPNISVEVSPLFALDKEELLLKLKDKEISLDQDTYFE